MITVSPLKTSKYEGFKQTPSSTPNSKQHKFYHMDKRLLLEVAGKKSKRGRREACLLDSWKFANFFYPKEQSLSLLIVLIDYSSGKLIFIDKYYCIIPKSIFQHPMTLNCIPISRKITPQVLTHQQVHTRVQEHRITVSRTPYI